MHFAPNGCAARSRPCRPWPALAAEARTSSAPPSRITTRRFAGSRTKVGVISRDTISPVDSQSARSPTCSASPSLPPCSTPASAGSDALPVKCGKTCGPEVWSRSLQPRSHCRTRFALWLAKVRADRALVLDQDCARATSALPQCINARHHAVKLPPYWTASTGCRAGYRRSALHSHADPHSAITNPEAATTPAAMCASPRPLAA